MTKPTAWSVKLSDNTWVTATAATGRKAMEQVSADLAANDRTDVTVVSASRMVPTGR